MKEMPLLQRETMAVLIPEDKRKNEIITKYLHWASLERAL